VVATANYVNGLISQTAGASPTPGIAYGNGTALSAIDYAPTGAVKDEIWSFTTGQPSFSDATVSSQSAKILRDTLTHGTTAYASTYTRDAADRLTGATVPDNTLTYAYAPQFEGWLLHRGNTRPHQFDEYP
jgi:YD repeat-containing protein